MSTFWLLLLQVNTDPDLVFALRFVQHLRYARLFIQTLILLKWNLTRHVDSVDTHNKSRVNSLGYKELLYAYFGKYAGR